MANGDHFFKMDGRGVRTFVAEHVPPVLAEMLERAGLHAKDVDHFGDLVLPAGFGGGMAVGASVPRGHAGQPLRNPAVRPVGRYFGWISQSQARRRPSATDVSSAACAAASALGSGSCAAGTAMMTACS